MENFNFALVEKKKFGSSQMPDNLVRVSVNGITLSRNVGGEYESYTTNSGAKGAKIQVEYDAVNQAIRLSRDEKGWSFLSRADDSLFRLSGGARLVQRGGIIVGDYVQVPGQPSVFVLAR